MPIGKNRGTTPAELLKAIQGHKAPAGKKQSQFEIETAMEFLLHTTVAGDRLLAQEERQTQKDIRAGGAPNFMGEAKKAIQEAKRQWQTALTSTPSQRKEAILAAVEAVKYAQKIAPGKLALAFKDGFACIYMSSTTADYINIIASGSKGKWVWARGWGPVGHPSYLELTSIPQERIIDQSPITSTWVAHAWLLMN